MDFDSKISSQSLNQCCPTFLVPRASYRLKLRPRAAIESFSEHYKLHGYNAGPSMPLTSMMHSPMAPYCAPPTTTTPRPLVDCRQCSEK